MAVLVAALDTNFTPAVGDFTVQVSGGLTDLVRRNAAGNAWTLVQSLGPNQAVVVSNPVAAADYRFNTLVSGVVPVVSANQ